MATGITPIWDQDAATLAAQYATLNERHPGRLLVGLGVSHGELKPAYRHPYAAMEHYLSALDAASQPVPADRRGLNRRSWCGELLRMGVLFDYFRSASDTAAVSLMDELGSGPVVTPDGGAADAVDLKGIDPTVTLGRLVGLARNIPWEVGLVATELLWTGDEQDGPWLTSIGDAARDTLASIGSADARNLSRQWGQTEELARNGPLSDDQLVPLIDRIAGLARRARDTGDHLYCWCSL